jgi:hypothetical protein
MLLSQVIRGVAITGRTDAVRSSLLGRQGGQWTQQWIDDAFPDASARTHAARAPAIDPAARMRSLADLRARGLVTDDEAARLRRARAR